MVQETAWSGDYYLRRRDVTDLRIDANTAEAAAALKSLCLANLLTADLISKLPCRDHDEAPHALTLDDPVDHRKAERRGLS